MIDTDGVIPVFRVPSGTFPIDETSQFTVMAKNVVDVNVPVREDNTMFLVEGFRDNLF